MGVVLVWLSCAMPLRQLGGCCPSNSLHARHPAAAFLLQCLALFQALYDCRIRAVHVTDRFALLWGHCHSSPLTPAFLPPPSRYYPPLLRLLHSQPPQGTLHLGGISSPVLENGLTPLTGSVYASAWRQYQSLMSGRLCPPRAPCVPEKVALSITLLGPQGLAVATIKPYLAGLCYYNIRSDPLNMFPSMYSPYIKLLLRSVQ